MPIIGALQVETSIEGHKYLLAVLQHFWFYVAVKEKSKSILKLNNEYIFNFNFTLNYNIFYSLFLPHFLLVGNI